MRVCVHVYERACILYIFSTSAMLKTAQLHLNFPYPALPSLTQPHLTMSSTLLTLPYRTLQYRFYHGLPSVPSYPAPRFAGRSGLTDRPGCKCARACVGVSLEASTCEYVRVIVDVVGQSFA